MRQNILNSNTKKAQQFIDNYFNHWESRCVYNAYNYGCSDNKLEAENRIKQEMDEVKGYDYRVCTHNTFMFTCGYCYVKDGKEFLRYHTPCYYDIEL